MTLKGPMQKIDRDPRSHATDERPLKGQRAIHHGGRRVSEGLGRRSREQSEA